MLQHQFICWYLSTSQADPEHCNIIYLRFLNICLFFSFMSCVTEWQLIIKSKVRELFRSSGYASFNSYKYHVL